MDEDVNLALQEARHVAFLIRELHAELIEDGVPHEDALKLAMAAVHIAYPLIMG